MERLRELIGIVEGEHVRLPGGIRLPDGLRVRVVVPVAVASPSGEGPSDRPDRLSDTEWRALLADLGSEIAPGTPPLSDRAVSRASFYEDEA